MDNTFVYKHRFASTSSSNEHSVVSITKPVYSYSHQEKCGTIDYKGRHYLIDMDDRNAIMNHSKHFVFSENDIYYPSFVYNKHRINYLNFLFHYREGNMKYIFQNGNRNDLRRKNVLYIHNYHDFVSQNYTIKKTIPGHFSKHGVDPFAMKNPLWEVEENGKTIILMYCEKDTLCKLCPDSYKKILDYESEFCDGKKLTWFKGVNGYIMCSNNLYIHQIITGCYGNGKGTKNISVDHIDRDPLNNTIENLRIATRDEQEKNSKGIMEGTKRARKSCAKPLPEGITQDMLAKYVVYYDELVYPAKITRRHYFKIEKHPKLAKIWIGTKSSRVSIQDKLAQANLVVENLEKNIYPEGF